MEWKWRRSKEKQMIRKFSWDVSRENQKLSNFRNANPSTKNSRQRMGKPRKVVLRN